MKPFTVQITKDATPEGRRPKTNEEALALWDEHMKNRPEMSTRGQRYAIKSFLSALPPGMLVLDVRPHHLKEYIAGYSKTCKNFMTHLGARGPGCRLAQDLKQCGMECPAYASMPKRSIQNRMQAVSSLFSILEYLEHIPANPMTGVRKAWQREFGHIIEPEPEVFRPKLEDVRKLIQGTGPIHRKMLYFVMAKTGIRIHESMKLRVDRDFMNLEEGWFKVSRGGKRKGNPYLIIDSELRSMLDDYLEWREANAKTALPNLLLNAKGYPLNYTMRTNVNRHLFQKDAIRLGLQAADAPAGKRWHSHSMRHFFSDHLDREGCDKLWWHVLRGDIVKGTQGVYIDLRDLDRIRQQYLRYAPVLSVRA